MASFNLRDPRVQGGIITGLLGAGALYVFFATSYVPLTYPVNDAQIKVLKADFEKKSNDLARARQSVADLPRFQAEFAALHERYEMAAELLPTDKEMPGILRRITLAGQQCGITFESFRPDPEVTKDHYLEVPIQLDIHGGYHEVGQFLAELSNMKRIMKISNLQLMANNKSSEGDDGGSTSARLTVTAYTLDPNAAAAAAAAQGKDGKAANKAAGQGGSNAGK
jgi:type IV pilus assembly protein PilO